MFCYPTVMSLLITSRESLHLQHLCKVCKLLRTTFFMLPKLQIVIFSIQKFIDIKSFNAHITVISIFGSIFQPFSLRSALKFSPTFTG